MSQIHNDSDGLRTFADQLSSFGSEVDEQLNKLGAAMSRLGDTWQDRGYEELKEEFSLTKQRVKLFIADTKKFRVKLKLRADVVDEIDGFHLSR